MDAETAGRAVGAPALRASYRWSSLESALPSFARATASSGMRGTFRWRNKGCGRLL